MDVFRVKWRARGDWSWWRLTPKGRMQDNLLSHCAKKGYKYMREHVEGPEHQKKVMWIYDGSSPGWERIQHPILTVTGWHCISSGEGVHSWTLPRGLV